MTDTVICGQTTDDNTEPAAMSQTQAKYWAAQSPVNDINENNGIIRLLIGRSATMVMLQL